MELVCLYILRWLLYRVTRPLVKVVGGFIEQHSFLHFGVCCATVVVSDYYCPSLLDTVLTRSLDL
jgi:hypothetical protein